MHKTANVLNKLPKRQQPEAKRAIWEIYRADNKTEANQAFNRFIQAYQAKYPEATQCLAKDRDVLLTFFDFPAEHWVHLRTTNPIESTFVTVRLRTDQGEAAYPRTPSSPWSSSWWRALRKAGSEFEASNPWPM